MQTPSGTPFTTMPPSPPSAPSGLNISNWVCEGSTYAVTLSWEDIANNEDGFRIYRNGFKLVALPADTTECAGASARLTVYEGGCIF